MNRTRLSTALALALTLAVGLPVVASADVPSREDIDYFSVLGEQRRAAEERAREPEVRFAGDEQRDRDPAAPRARSRGTNHYPYQIP